MLLNLHFTYPYLHKKTFKNLGISLMNLHVDYLTQEICLNPSAKSAWNFDQLQQHFIFTPTTELKFNQFSLWQIYGFETKQQ